MLITNGIVTRNIAAKQLSEYKARGYREVDTPVEEEAPAEGEAPEVDTPVEEEAPKPKKTNKPKAGDK